jgi:predicted transcriptional regulator
MLCIGIIGIGSVQLSQSKGMLDDINKYQKEIKGQKTEIEKATKDLKKSHKQLKTELQDGLNKVIDKDVDPQVKQLTKLLKQLGSDYIKNPNAKVGEKVKNFFVDLAVGAAGLRQLETASIAIIEVLEVLKKELQIDTDSSEYKEIKEEISRLDKKINKNK